MASNNNLESFPSAELYLDTTGKLWGRYIGCEETYTISHVTIGFPLLGSLRTTEPVWLPV